MRDAPDGVDEPISDEHHPDEPELSLTASAAATFRLLVAWACVGLGVLDLAMGVDLADPAYLIFHLMLVIAGVVLLSWGRVAGRPSRTALVAGGAVTVLGLVISALPPGPECCLQAYADPHGFPFPMLTGNGFPAWHAVADLIFWGLAGVLVVAVMPARRAPALRPSAPSTHAEQRATPAAEPVPDKRNVGGLP